MKKVDLKISGLHCVSCCFSIDGELEDSAGVTESNTSYAKSETLVTFDEQKINIKRITEIIKKLGYEAEIKTKD